MIGGHWIDDHDIDRRLLYIKCAVRLDRHRPHATYISGRVAAERGFFSRCATLPRFRSLTFKLQARLPFPFYTLRLFP